MMLRLVIRLYSSGMERISAIRNLWLLWNYEAIGTKLAILSSAQNDIPST